MSKHEVFTSPTPATGAVLTTALEHSAFAEAAAGLDPVFDLIAAEADAFARLDEACGNTDSVALGREPTVEEEAEYEAANRAQETALDRALQANARTPEGLCAMMDLFELREMENVGAPIDDFLSSLLQSVRRFVFRAYQGDACLSTALSPTPGADREVDALWREHLRICAWQMEVDREAKRQGRSDDAFFEETSDAFWANYEAIKALEFSPEAVAARVLIAANIDGITYYTLADQGVMKQALVGLRPVLSGPVAETVDDYLNNPDRPFAYGPLWGSEVESGLSAIDMYLRTQSNRPSA